LDDISSLSADSLVGQIIAAARQAIFGAAALPSQIGDHLFNRSAGRKLNDRETDCHDPDNGRNDQQKPPQNIGNHYRSPILRRSAKSAICLSMVVKRFCPLHEKQNYG